MKAQFFKTLWGHPESIRSAALQAHEAGFAGLEGPWPESADHQSALSSALGEFHLSYIVEISATGYATPAPGSTVSTQLESFERLLDAGLQARPLLFTTMAGSDLWPFRESVEFLTAAWEIAQDRGVQVGFETHRSRSLFHPVRTMELLAELPPVELTVDFSHWCVVCERLVLDELPEVLAACAERVLHIHARVGHDQGAQVADPRAPEYAPAVEAHLRWWRALWEGQRRRGKQIVTMTPEFGPDGYLPCEPFTQKPVADLWELNHWTAGRVRSAFDETFS